MFELNFHRFEYGFDNSNQRLEILRDVWESLIRLLFAIVVGEFICSNISMVEANISRNHIFSDKLHDKLMVIKKLVELASIKEFPFSFLSIIDIDVVNKLEELNKVRNLFSHISALSEDQARQMIIDHLDHVLAILKQLENLSNITIIRCIGQYDSNQSHSFNIRCERFKGFAINRDIRTLTVQPEQLSKYIPYFNSNNVLVKIEESIFSVSPFLSFIRDGHHTKLCFYIKKGGTEPNRKFTYEIIAESRGIEKEEVIFAEEISKLNILLPNTANSGRTQITREKQV